MRIYVDELPNNCSDCPCYDYEYSCCNVTDIDLCITDNFSRYEQRHKNCPLLSLADHTKQVRKEMVEEIKKKLPDFIYNFQEPETPRTKVVELEDIKYILDQIQGNN